jgi:hypothetical protein
LHSGDDIARLWFEVVADSRFSVEIHDRKQSGLCTRLKNVALLIFHFYDCCRICCHHVSPQGSCRYCGFPWLANVRVAKDDQALHQPHEPTVAVSPVASFENDLPPRLRRLALRPNPLQCMGDTMVAGDKLVIGQAVCFDGYEFGLADNGKVTFF